MHTDIHSLSDSFPTQIITEYWVELSVLCSRSPLVNHSIYVGVHMSVPNTQSITQVSRSYLQFKPSPKWPYSSKSISTLIHSSPPSLTTCSLITSFSESNRPGFNYLQCNYFFYSTLVNMHSNFRIINPYHCEKRITRVQCLHLVSSRKTIFQSYLSQLLFLWFNSN